MVSKVEPSDEGSLSIDPERKDFDNVLKVDPSALWSQDEASLYKRKARRLSKTEFFFSKKVGEALSSYNMIDENDKILVALSGGESSFSLLKVLNFKRRNIPVKYQIKVCFIDTGYDDARRKEVEDYLKKNGFDYIIEKLNPKKIRAGKPTDCYWCAFSRYKRLFKVAAGQGCSKIALGQHKDDMVEGFLDDLFFKGIVRRVTPKESFLRGRFQVIRPLVLCEKEFITQYSKASKFPTIERRCAGALTPRRRMMRDALGKVHKKNKDIKTNIFRSIDNINYDYLPKSQKAV
ncbi:ATP-binding protein [Candidatus Omnitrophota bacterium]